MKKVLVAVLGMILIGSVAAFFILGDKRLKQRHIKAAEEILGLEFTPEEREMMLEGIKRNLASYQELRSVKLENHIPPALLFDPVGPPTSGSHERQIIALTDIPDLSLPENLDKTWHSGRLPSWPD